MKYKVGDKVRIKSLDWYNENKDEYGDIPLIEKTCSRYNFVEKMRGLCGKVMTISSVSRYHYDMVEDNGECFWTDEMIEGFTEYLLPDGYIFKDENGNIINATKIVLEKKINEYPETYKECCKVLDIQSDWHLTFELNNSTSCDLCVNNEFDYVCRLEAFRKLLICRDAYWKIAGDEMGLGKSWKPDWNNISDKYCIYFVSGDVWSKECQTRQCPFAFPTAEMRDAFYDNFKSLIEHCKELL